MVAEGGPTAAANFEAGYEGFATRQYRGMGIVTSDPFEARRLSIKRLTSCVWNRSFN